MAIQLLILATLTLDVKTLKKAGLDDVKAKGAKFTTSSSLREATNRLVEMFKTQKEFKAVDQVAGEVEISTRSGKVVLAERGNLVVIHLE